MSALNRFKHYAGPIGQTIMTQNRREFVPKIICEQPIHEGSHTHKIRFSEGQDLILQQMSSLMCRKANGQLVFWHDYPISNGRPYVREELCTSLQERRVEIDTTTWECHIDFSLRPNWASIDFGSDAVEAHACWPMVSESPNCGVAPPPVRQHRGVNVNTVPNATENSLRKDDLAPEIQ